MKKKIYKEDCPEESGIQRQRQVLKTRLSFKTGDNDVRALSVGVTSLPTSFKRYSCLVETRLGSSASGSEARCGWVDGDEAGGSGTRVTNSSTTATADYSQSTSTLLEQNEKKKKKKKKK